ncbi:MAG: hypothetical protein ACN6O6_19190 [Pseudomonas sp.]|uniref:hypothetical protein n=1 Tax=Pseudomonas sp. TaxID=306 RepID=UPI003D152232
MGSWIRCKCDALVHKNLFCGTGVSLAVSEETLDISDPETPAEQLISKIIYDSEMLLKCENCGRIMLLKETREEFTLRFYQLEQE